MSGWLIDQIMAWLAGAILATLTALWGLLEQTAFTSPDVTVLPQVAAISGRSLMIVNAAFILAVITVGVTVMTHETVQIRYGLGDLLPRLVVGFIAANFATPICRNLINGANTLTVALTGDSIAAEGSFGQMRRVVTDALNSGSAAFLLVVIGLIIAVLTGMLLVVWLVRVGVLIVLVGVAPLALACHATPFTEPVATLWWRSMLGVLATVTVQALAMHTALSVFLDPDANAGSLGIPHDPAGVSNLFIVACLLWVVVKIPGLMRRYATRGSGTSNAGMVVRMMVIQAVSRVVRLPLGRHSGRAATTAGAGAAGGPSVASTAISYWRPRLPRPTPGGTRTPRPTPAARSATPSSAGRTHTGAGPGRAGTTHPTRPPVRPYTRDELAGGVDLYTRAMKARAAGRADAAAAGTAYPARRPVRPYTRDELAGGVDLYTRAMKARAAWPVRKALP